MAEPEFSIEPDESDMRALERKMKMLPEIAKKELSSGMHEGTMLVQAAAKRNAPKGKRQQLAASIDHNYVVKDGVIVRADVGSDLKYAKAQELGATINAHQAGALTIPFPGVEGFARDYEDTIIVKPQGSKHSIIAQVVGEDQIKPLFTLVKKVEITPQPYLKPAMDKNADKFLWILGRQIRKALKYVANS